MSWTATARPSSGTTTLADLRPEDLGPGTETWSDEVDRLVYGSQRVVVVDSSFLIAYFNTRDVHHAAATRAMVQLRGGTWGQAVLLEYVFLEVVTLIGLRRDHAAASRVGSTLLGAREVRFQPSAELFLDAWRVFQEAGAARLSFADAAIVVAARRESPGNILSFDEDFRSVAGVTALLSQPEIAWSL